MCCQGSVLDFRHREQKIETDASKAKVALQKDTRGWRLQHLPAGGCGWELPGLHCESPRSRPTLDKLSVFARFSAKTIFFPN